MRDSERLYHTVLVCDLVSVEMKQAVLRLTRLSNRETKQGKTSRAGTSQREGGEGKGKKKRFGCGCAPEKASWSPSRTWIDLDGVCVLHVQKCTGCCTPTRNKRARHGCVSELMEAVPSNYRSGFKGKGARAESREIQADRLLTCMGCFGSAAPGRVTMRRAMNKSCSMCSQPVHQPSRSAT